MGVRVNRATASTAARPDVVFCLEHCQLSKSQSQSRECPTNLSSTAMDPVADDTVREIMEQLKNVQS